MKPLETEGVILIIALRGEGRPGGWYRPDMRPASQAHIASRDTKAPAVLSISLQLSRWAHLASCTCLASSCHHYLCNCISHITVYFFKKNFSPFPLFVQCSQFFIRYDGEKLFFIDTLQYNWFSCSLLLFGIVLKKKIRHCHYIFNEFNFSLVYLYYIFLKLLYFTRFINLWSIT